MAEPAAVVRVSREREEREVLPVHVVLEVEDARETCPRNLRFFPRAVALLRVDEITQAALHTAAIEIAAGGDAHERPRSLRSGAFAFALQRWIVVRGARFPPAAIRILTALEPIASAQ